MADLPLFLNIVIPALIWDDGAQKVIKDDKHDPALVYRCAGDLISRFVSFLCWKSG